MLSISSGAALARALTLPLPDGIRDLLLLRLDQLGGEFKSCARFVIVQPRDTLSALEETLGWSVLQNAGDGTWYGDADFTPSVEWALYHPGVGWELVFQFTDDFSHVIVVSDTPGIHETLLEFCRTCATEHASA